MHPIWWSVPIIILSLLLSNSRGQPVCPPGASPVTVAVGSVVICSPTIAGQGCPTTPATETVCIPIAAPAPTPPPVAIGAPPDVSRESR